MSTQQDIYAAGSENRPPMLNKDNYVPWSSRLLHYAKSKLNGKLIYNSIMNGPYVRRMIPEPGDTDREVLVAKTFHEHIDDELTDKEVKKIEVDDQEIWLRIQQMMKGSVIGIQDKKDKLFNERERRFTSTDGESIESYYHRFSKLMNDFRRNKHFPKMIASNLKFLNNLQPEWRRHFTIVHQTKDLHELDYTQLYDFLKYNQAEVNELRAERLARAHYNSQVKDNKTDLFVQQYEQFTILEEESIDSGFARFNTIITSLKALDEELKDLSSLALDELIGNLKVHEVVIEKNSEIYRGKKERVKSITFKAKKELLMEKYFRHPEAMTKNMLWPCGDPNHLIGDCPKPSRNKDQKAFIGGSWSDSKNDAETKTNEKRVSCSIANEKNS
ncbi:hypothetical protein Tco_1066482 [Tanacetum coccineum]|uniref:Uncharacterized protein n=1 Tax=Tanacetum coccineum TaxID=301880 RepID=A0ABQ5HBT5_9ASTR